MNKDHTQEDHRDLPVYEAPKLTVLHAADTESANTMDPSEGFPFIGPS